VAEQVERAICAAVPEITTVQTHLEPLAEPGSGIEVDAAELEAAVARAAGGPPRELRLLWTDEGVVALLTLGLDPGTSLADAHARASEVEERLRRERPDVADVIVHTEP
jgi:divalent metal cation (Fe/Co/Zn/Cd) transporter